MCGLVGFAGKIDGVKGKRSLAEGLLVCGVRGMDSTGIAAVDKGGKTWDTCKTIGSAIELFNYLPFDRMTFYNRQALIGHCRAATRGKVTRFNAHPFEHENVVGVHNGTLHSSWNTKLEDAKNFDVDSEALIYNIAKFGVEEVIPEVEGAWALVWWDKVANDGKGTLNFLRNKERPLWYAYSEDNENLIWASETWMITAMCREGRFKLAKSEEGYTFFSFPEDQWVRFNIDLSAKKGEVITRLQDVEVKGALPPPKAPPVHYGATGGNGGQGTGPFRETDRQGILPNPVGSGTTPISSKNSLTGVPISRNQSGFHTPKNLLITQQDNSGKPYGVSSLLTQRDTRSAPSTRFISAMNEWYISQPGWSPTSVEMSWGGFKRNTGGCCSSCGAQAADVHAVGYIMPMNNAFLCKRCVQPPPNGRIMRQILNNKPMRTILSVPILEEEVI